MKSSVDASFATPARVVHLLRAAQRVLPEVLRFEQPTDRVLARFFGQHRGLGSRDRTTVADTIYAILRYKTLFETQAGAQDSLQRLVLLGFAGPMAALLPVLAEPERIWLQACASQDVQALPDACRHNLPAWLAMDLHLLLDDAFDAATQALLQPAPLDLRVNSMRQKRPRVQASLQALGIDAAPTPWSPWGLRVAGKPGLRQLELYQQGVLEIQDEGSQLLALLVGARRGETVADYCAGAGGKTLALGAAMRATGRLYALDVSASRLAILDQRVRRSGLTNVHTMVLSGAADARLQRLQGKMDRVLVDAPCSGLGTLRRSPDLKWRQPQAAIPDFALRQARILAQAARLVRPGGRLVYATCSLLAQENEAVAAVFDAGQSQFSALPAAQVLADLKVAQAHDLCTADGRYLRLWPHLHGTDGFFAAIWQRR